MKKNSVKNTRINSEVMKVLSELIRSEVKDPRIPQFTSVTDVEVAPDLKTAKVWVSFLCDADAVPDALKGLKCAEGFLRSQIAKKVNLRNTPTLTFIYDSSIEYGNRMNKLIEEANKGINQDV